MIRQLSLTLLVLLVLAAPAAARPVVGIGDQHPHMFSDPDFVRLGVTNSRFQLAWDWYRDPAAIAETDAWIAAARTAGVKPMVAFNRTWRSGGERKLPSLTLYKKSFRLFRARYPDVREFSAWNEANHSLQPTSRKPRAAALYFNAMRRGCPSCTIVAADVLDSNDMLGWIKTFKRYAPKARIWGVHNYKDANDGTNSTKALLKAVRGQVWLTETGGILRLKPQPGSRGNGRRSSQAKQAAAVKRVYKIAGSSRRITRIYFYEWQAQPKQRWDSAFLTADGSLRPAYHALKRGLRR
jgi:hypothetical protein